MIDNYNERLKKIEHHIYAVLPESSKSGWVSDVAGPVFCNVDENFYNNINIPSIDLVKRGGKRWRPMMMLLFCELESGSQNVLPLTPLVELPHNGSLMIDDIEDGADLRRGKEAVHLIYGVDMAINSGNFLYFLPSFLIEKSDFPDSVKLKLYRYYCENMRRLHLGQGLDIQWHNNHDIYPDVNEYLQMCRYKTGSLARMAAELGVIAGGGSEKGAVEMGQACEEMGVAFQILDDVTNLTTGNPGKKRGDDIVEGKKSLPVIFFNQEGGDIKTLSSLFRTASSLGIERGNDAVEEAIRLLEVRGSIEKAENTAVEILESSRKKIVSKYSPCEALDLINFMFDSFTGK